MKNIFLCAALSLAASFAAAEVSIQHAWARATVPAQKTTGAFMQMTSDRDVRLVEATSPLAGAVELHGTELAAGVTKMRPVAALALGAGKTVELKPGGYHFMLVDLKQQLRPGDRLPLDLVFADARNRRTTVNVTVPVNPINSTAAHAH